MVHTKYKKEYGQKEGATLSTFVSLALMITGGATFVLVTWARLTLGFYGIGLALVTIGYIVGVFTGGGLKHEEEVE
jgi:hypothetical protein